MRAKRPKPETPIMNPRGRTRKIAIRAAAPNARAVATRGEGNSFIGRNVAVCRQHMNIQTHTTLIDNSVSHVAANYASASFVVVCRAVMTRLLHRESLIDPPRPSHMHEGRVYFTLIRASLRARARARGLYRKY